jgi:hypothetical protein
MWAKKGIESTCLYRHTARHQHSSIHTIDAAAAAAAAVGLYKCVTRHQSASIHFPMSHTKKAIGYNSVCRGISQSPRWCAFVAARHILPICMYCIRSKRYKFHADFHPPKQQPKKYTQGKIKPTIYYIPNTCGWSCAASLSTYNTTRKSINI